MKKLFALAAILILILGDCDTGSDYGETGKTGPGGGTIFFAEGSQYMECSGELGDTTWAAAMTTAKNYNGGGFSDWHLPTRNELDLMYKNLKKNDLGGFSADYYWTSAESGTSAYCQHFGNGSQGTQGKSNSYGVRAVRAYSNDSVTDTNTTTLKINNLSFTEITDVIWQNVSFANNQYENSIKPGTNVTAAVQAGGGYIFFKRKSNPITARTEIMVVVEKNQQVEFTFTDNTVIVEVNNPDNNGTLGALQSTVVWWDDAEGELQPYYEARSFVGYYKESGNLLDYYSGSYRNSNYFYPPKNGTKSIAIGGTVTAMLHLKINLTRRAKLSFWYANRFNESAGTVFSINNEEERKWTADVNWSFMEVELEPGVNDLIWEKKDGYLSSSNAPYYRCFYLSLDDILIYYTE